MTLARRLILQRGGASIIAPSDSVATITTAPDGGWTAVSTPHAVSHNGYTYVTWVNGSSGNAYVVAINESTGAVATPVLIDTMGGSPDTHQGPALLVRASDHKLMMAFCLHDGANLFYRLSTTSLDTDPDLSDGLAAAVNLDSSLGGTFYTYPSLFQLTGVANDPIYLFARETGGAGGYNLRYIVSTDGGSTWSAHTELYNPAGIPYYALASDGSSRIDLFSSDRDPYGSEGGTLVISHAYFDGSAWRASDGTALGSTPYTASDLTTVYDGADGNAFPMDGVSSANPVLGYLVSDGSTTTARYARWDGAAWDVTQIYTGTAHPVDRFYGSLAFNRADPDEVFSGRYSGASSSEMWRLNTSDTGATWAGSQITTGSSDLNASPTPVIGGVAALPVLWLRGTVTHFTDFSLGIRALLT